jgi:hypothetical protein
VNLGVVKENPSTCKGVIEILKHLHQYVPSTAKADPYQLISHTLINIVPEDLQ